MTWSPDETPRQGPGGRTVRSALAVGSELCVCDLAWVCGLSQNLVSHHVRQLRAAGMATSRRDGKLVMYRLTPIGATLLTAVLGTGPELEVEVRKRLPWKTSVARWARHSLLAFRPIGGGGLNAL